MHTTDVENPVASPSGETRPTTGSPDSASVLPRSIWFGRIVLAGATILFTLVAFRQIVDPIGSSVPHQIALGSSDAITITRVTGGLFLGLALVLVACVVSERRLLMGLGALATVSAVVTAVRVLGVIVDGPGPFSLQVLKPEVALVALSSIAFFVERRRRHRSIADLAPVPDGAQGAAPAAMK